MVTRTIIRISPSEAEHRTATVAAAKEEKNLAAGKNDVYKKRQCPSDEDETVTAKRARWREAKQKKKCTAEGCTNQVYRGGVCIKHGAKVKRCSIEGCTNHIVKGGVCMKHGAIQTRKRCSVEGCTNQSRKGGVCARHGAEAKQCSSEGCTNKAQKGGVCQSHGAKRTICSSEGCTSQAQQGGVCKRHGAKVRVKRCMQ